MKVIGINPNFGRLDISRLGTIEKLYINDLSLLNKMSEGVDVFMKKSSWKFKYHNADTTVPAIKISARPLKLNFFEKLFGLKTKNTYLPTGNLKDILDNKYTMEETFSKLIEQVKKGN